MKTYLEENSGKGWEESPSVSSGIENRKPHPKASLSVVAHRGNHKKALKLCSSEILTHLAVGAVYATYKGLPKSRIFTVLSPHTSPAANISATTHGGAGANLISLGKRFRSVSHL